MAAPKITKPATSQGATTPSAAKPTTAPQDYLAPISQQQITGQARQTINSAYQPQYTTLNQAGKQAKALASKRSQDLKQYQSWLSTQLNQLQASTDASNNALSGLVNQIQGQQAGLAGQSQGLVDQANARAGNVSNNAQSNPLTAGIAQNQAYANNLTSNAEQGAVRNALASTNSFAATRANDLSYLGSLNAKVGTDLQTTLTDIANKRAVLKQTQTGDVAKEIARLQGVEIQKAQSTRDYTTAVQQLQLQSANIGSEIDKRVADATNAANRTKIDATNADTNRINSQLRLTALQQDQANRDRNYQLDVQKLGDSAAKDKYLRDHGLGVYKPDKSGQKKDLSQTSQNAIIKDITRIQASLKLLISKGYPIDQAYHIVQTGRKVQIGTATHKDAYGNDVTTPTYYTAPAADNVQYLNAAYNTAGVGGVYGLTQGDINALLNSGLSYSTITQHFNLDQRTPAQKKAHPVPEITGVPHVGP